MPAMSEAYGNVGRGLCSHLRLLRRIGDDRDPSRRLVADHVLFQVLGVAGWWWACVYSFLRNKGFFDDSTREK